MKKFMILVLFICSLTSFAELSIDQVEAEKSLIDTKNNQGVSVTAVKFKTLSAEVEDAAKQIAFGEDDVSAALVVFEGEDTRKSRHTVQSCVVTFVANEVFALEHCQEL